MALPNYAYDPLEDSHNDFRLLQIYPCKKNERLVGRIRRFAMKDAPAYTAISYCWGNDPADKELVALPVEATQKPDLLKIINDLIYIPRSREPNTSMTPEVQIKPHDRNFTSCRRLMITANVESALRSMFSFERVSRYIWIDSICINQSDTIEKGAQVKQMARIYQNSNNLNIWLGEECNNSNLAFDLLFECLPEFHKLHLSESYHLYNFFRRFNHKTQHWQALAKLIQRPWFRRRWIIQEIAMSRDAAVFCGQRHTPWAFMILASSYFGFEPALWAREGRIAYQRIENLGVRAGMIGLGRSNQLTLSVLLRWFRNYQCSNPKDTVYSLLSLASDVDESWVPDYTDATSISDLYLQTFMHVVKSDKSLDLLGFAVDWPGDPCWPSWLPSWQGKIRYIANDPMSMTEEYIPATLSWFDVFNGLKEGRSYCASGSMEPILNIRNNTLVLFEDKTFKLLPTLELEGYEVDKISYVSTKRWRQDRHDYCHFQKRKKTIPEEWLHMALCRGAERCSGMEEESCALPAIDRSEQLPETFWRTMIGNRFTTNLQPGETMPTIQIASKPCGELLSLAHYRGVVDYLKPLDQYEGMHMHQVTNAFNTVQTRRSFATTETSIGWVPLNARSGDKIYIISGCSVPIILRPMTKLCSVSQESEGSDNNTDVGNIKISDIGDESQLYVLIGQCYVQGLMEGEFMSGHRSNEGDVLPRRYLVA